MTDFDSDHNSRQYNLMLRNISLYQEDSIRLGDLVNTLEALNGALQHPTSEWSEAFEPAWGKLEDVYAVMLDEGRTESNAVEIMLIKDSVARLRALIQHELEQSNQ